MTESGPGSTRAHRWWWHGFRPLLLRLHFFVGLFVAPFVLIAALTGLLYSFSPQLAQLVHAEQLRVPVGDRTVGLDEQVAAAQRAVPEGSVVEVRPPTTEDGTTRVSFAGPQVDADRARTAFIDPYTGEVRGVLTTYAEWLPVRAWFDTLHRTLMLGDVGRVYSELAASWLWVLALSGLAIWIVRVRNRRRLRRTALPQTSGRGRMRLLSWHGSLGLWAAVGMLFLSATGLTWSQFAGGHVSQLRSQLDWSTPAVHTTLPGAAGAIPAEQVGTVSERVLAASRSAGLDGPIAIQPGAAGEAWTVSQVKRSWPEQQDSIAVDPASGRVVDRIDFADWPIAAKLARWGIDLHMGLLFGPANQIALAALAVSLICMIIWGYRMWWLRRPTRADAVRRIAPPLGAGTTPSRIAVLTVAGLAVVVGMVLPVLGASLLIFLTGDAVIISMRAGTVSSRSRPKSVDAG